MRRNDILHILVGPTWIEHLHSFSLHVLSHGYTNSSSITEEMGQKGENTTSDLGTQLLSNIPSSLDLRT